MKKLLTSGLLLTAALALSASASTTLSGQSPAPAKPPMADKIVLWGDLAYFQGRGKPDNCILKSRYKRGEPVGFRMMASDPLTGEPAVADLVVHLTYAGQSVDIPMRYRGTGPGAIPGFYVAKWIVPDDAPVGIVRYIVTAKDKTGRTGEWKPIANDQSQLTIAE